MKVRELIEELSKYDSEMVVRLSIVQTDGGTRYSTNADAKSVTCLGKMSTVFINAEID